MVCRVLGSLSVCLFEDGNVHHARGRGKLDHYTDDERKETGAGGGAVVSKKPIRFFWKNNTLLFFSSSTKCAEQARPTVRIAEEITAEDDTSIDYHSMNTKHSIDGVKT